MHCPMLIGKCCPMSIVTNTVVIDEGITALAQNRHVLSNVDWHARSNVDWANTEVTDADKAAVDVMVAGR